MEQGYPCDFFSLRRHACVEKQSYKFKYLPWFSLLFPKEKGRAYICWLQLSATALSGKLLKKYSIPLKSMIYSLNKTRKCCWILQHIMYSAHNKKKQLTGCCPKTCSFAYLRNDFTKVENKYVNFWLIVLEKHHDLFTCTWFMYRKRIFNKINYVSSWYPDKWLLLLQRWTLQGLIHRQ